jgi:hypothetical protein
VQIKSKERLTENPQTNNQRRSSWRRGADWSIAGVSVVGTSHIESRLPCQDRFEFAIGQRKDGAESVVAVVSDGASSASRAKQGAEVTCSTLLREVARALAASEPSKITDACVYSWFSAVRENIRKIALVTQLEIADFSATALLVVAGEFTAICAQVGDGGIIVQGSKRQNAEIAFWPERGRGDATFFATSEQGTEHIRIRRFEDITGIMLFSDGLQGVILDESNASVYEQYCSKFLYSNALSSDEQSLAEHVDSFLVSDYVNARTDDDKSLVVARRL